MASKGTVSKEKVFAELAKIFGENWVGVFDKKGYINFMEDGAPVQVCVSLTCPKNPVGNAEAAQTPEPQTLDWSATPAATPAPVAEVTEEEKQNISDLLARLGL